MADWFLRGLAAFGLIQVSRAHSLLERRRELVEEMYALEEQAEQDMAEAQASGEMTDAEITEARRQIRASLRRAGLR